MSKFIEIKTSLYILFWKFSQCAILFIHTLFTNQITLISLFRHIFHTSIFTIIKNYSLHFLLILKSSYIKLQQSQQSIPLLLFFFAIFPHCLYLSSAKNSNKGFFIQQWIKTCNWFLNHSKRFSLFFLVLVCVFALCCAMESPSHKHTSPINQLTNKTDFRCWINTSHSHSVEHDKRIICTSSSNGEFFERWRRRGYEWYPKRIWFLLVRGFFIGNFKYTLKLCKS